MDCPMCFKVFPESIIVEHAILCVEHNSKHAADQRYEIDKEEKAEENVAGSSKQGKNRNMSSSKTIDGYFSPRRTSVSSVQSKKDADAFSKDEPTPNSGSVKQTVMKKAASFKPLADQMRPMSLAEFVGQEHIVGSNSLLRRVIEADDVPSMILWGPPGCGKTSLANVINFRIQRSKDYKFITLSAASSGVNDVKEVVKIAKSDQDIFLPFVENGTITLIGATTENPSFSLNSSLLSRCRVFVLEKLTVEQVERILDRALEHLGIDKVDSVDDLDENSCTKGCSYIDSSVLNGLAQLTDGDARVALNCLSLALQSQRSTTNNKNSIVITRDDISESFQRSHLLYDRQGDEHFNCISALHKSMRGSDANAALYWLGRILEGGEDPRFVARRLIRFASEDIGMVDPTALNQAVSAFQACQFIGMPECDVVLAQCVVYMSWAPKSIQVYEAYSRVKACIREHSGPLPPVPLHLRNAPTQLMKSHGYGKGYKYNPLFTEPVEQEYLPECLKDKIFLVKNA